MWAIICFTICYAIVTSGSGDSDAATGGVLKCLVYTTYFIILPFALGLSPACAAPIPYR